MPIEFGRVYDEFEFPSNLSEMTPDQRETLYRRYQASRISNDDHDFMELSPSETVDVQSDEYVRQQEIERRQREAHGPRGGRNVEVFNSNGVVLGGSHYDPERGWIVEYEDPRTYDARGDGWASPPRFPNAREVSRAEAFKIDQEARQAELQKIENERIASLPTPVRDADERFGDIL